MADNLTVEQRKKNMQHIKSKDTKIEIALRKALWNKGYRYRKNYCLLPGKPDIVLTKYKIAIFCDSEFFHGKDWEILKPRLQKTKNSDYWVNKISRNRERDAEIDKLNTYTALLAEYSDTLTKVTNGTFTTDSEYANNIRAKFGS